MRSKYQLFTDHKEWFAAGFYKNESSSYLRRHADAICEYLANAPFCKWESGALLYPSGNVNYWNPCNTLRVSFEFSYSIIINDPEPPAELTGTEKLSWEMAIREMSYVKNTDIPEKYCIGGNGYTHSVINFERILAEGLLQYRERIAEARAKNDSEFLAAIAQVLEAIISRHGREIEYLRNSDAPQELKDALARVPLYPAETLEEAFAAFNYMWYLDGNDSMGRSDKVLGKYCKDGEYGKAEKFFAALWRNSDSRGGWHTIWGDDPQMTCAAIRGQRKYSRPNSGCLVSEETPDFLWDEIFDAWAAGNPSPALYSRANYTPEITARLELRPGDENHYCYGGCTELMVEGRSNVGSIDCGINILDIFTQIDMTAFNDFESFYRTFTAETLRQLHLSMDSARINHIKMSQCRPQLIRSLFIEDCIDRNLEYNAGGARYNAFVCHVAGLSNTINSLYALKKKYDGSMPFNVQELKDALAANFSGCETIQKQLLQLPKFGNDITEVDEIAKDLSARVFSTVASQRGVRGNGPFYGGIIIFQTFEWLGSYVMATPDGRNDGDAIGDCAGAVHGTDRNGPTALLKSTACLDQFNSLGTVVMNLRINKQSLQDAVQRQNLKALVLSYFAMGGLQIQVTVADQETLQKAIKDPDKYPDLIIRIGGYSTYFRNLSNKERELVAKRMEHSF